MRASAPCQQQELAITEDLGAVETAGTAQRLLEIVEPGDGLAVGLQDQIALAQPVLPGRGQYGPKACCR